MNMLINVGFFLLGCLVTASFFLILRRFKKIETSNNRKGILLKSFTVGESIKSNMRVDIEVEETESSVKKSKIKILNIWFSQSSHDSEDMRIKIKKMIDGTWIDKGDVEWLERSKDYERQEKLDKILN